MTEYNVTHEFEKSFATLREEAQAQKDKDGSSKPPLTEEKQREKGKEIG